MQQEVEQHLVDSASRQREVDDTLAIVEREKHKRASKGHPYRVSVFRQIRTALKREFQQRLGDKFTFWARQLTTFVMSFGELSVVAWTQIATEYWVACAVVGSAFYQLPDTSSSLFLRGGACLLSFIYPSLLALAETTAAFEGRPILAKHNGFKLYRPSALVIAQTVADIPLFFPSIFEYGLVIYFMAGLKSSAGAFFTCQSLLIVTLCDNY
jgi:ABC-type multidrug transport system permease subunit